MPTVSIALFNSHVSQSVFLFTSTWVLYWSTTVSLDIVTILFFQFLSCLYDVTFCKSYLSDCLLKTIQILSKKTKKNPNQNPYLLLDNFFFLKKYMKRVFLRCKEFRSSSASINIRVFPFGLGYCANEAGSSILTVKHRKQHQMEHIPWPLSFHSPNRAKVSRK